MSLAIVKVLGYPVGVSVPGLLLAFAASALSGMVAGIHPSFRRRRFTRRTSSAPEKWGDR
jgi:hypothetical protein